MRTIFQIIWFQIAYERSVKDSDILNARLQKLQQDFEAQLITCDGLNQENQGKAMELKVQKYNLSIMQSKVYKWMKTVFETSWMVSHCFTISAKRR